MSLCELCKVESPRAGERPYISTLNFWQCVKLSDEQEAKELIASFVEEGRRFHKDKMRTEHQGDIYGYGHSKVLFKPTKAAKFPFRPTGNEAMSYFVGGKNVEGGYDEDGGFAINGGKGWSEVTNKAMEKQTKRRTRKHESQSCEPNKQMKRNIEKSKHKKNNCGERKTRRHMDEMGKRKEINSMVDK